MIPEVGSVDEARKAYYAFDASHRHTIALGKRGKRNKAHRDIFENISMLERFGRHNAIVSFLIMDGFIERIAVNVMQAEYRAIVEDAKAAGIPIFMGYGWTPGLTNFLARYGYDKMDKDKPMKMNVSWGGGAADSEGLAVVYHVLYAVTGQIPSFLKSSLIRYIVGGPAFLTSLLFSNVNKTKRKSSFERFLR